jgi:hypothetical protein
MRTFLAASFVMLAIQLHAEKKYFGLPPTDLRAGSLHQGDLFTVKMIPADHETLFYVVGKKAGTFRSDKIKMAAILNENGEEKRFTLTRRQNTFILDKKIEKDLELELKGEGPEEVDRLKIKVQP